MRTKTMKENKNKKHQDDRLLKRLSLKERRYQEEIRRLIAKDDMFKLV
ncbi:MAG TPA: hypothetical protein VFN31_01730 [Candidatus Saccharimonadales bacterium]|nr:hypothetical protein [Candidatus Saccharimonadales bacterium]